MKKHRRERPSAYEVAIEKGEVAENLCPYCGQHYARKGDYQRPVDVSGPVGFRDYLKGLMMMYYRLGCPPSTTFHWLGLFFATDEDVKRTAAILEIAPDAVYQRLATLKRHFDKTQHPKKPKI